MSSLPEARSHLEKAREFMRAATLSNEQALCNAAASSAVTSGINSKDTICLVLTGRTGKSDNHAKALAELKGSGPAGAEVASTLGRLLTLKQKSQYQAASTSATDATKAVQWAGRMLAAAERVMAG